MVDQSRSLNDVAARVHHTDAEGVAMVWCSNTIITDLLCCCVGDSLCGIEFLCLYDDAFLIAAYTFKTQFNSKVPL